MAHFRFDLERDELAQKLGGGLPRSALCVVVGEAGAGKSILCERLAYGVLQHGARPVYVSTELGLHSFLEQMRSVGYAIELDLLSRKLSFFTTHPAQGRAVPRALQLLRLLGSPAVRRHDAIIVDRLSSLLRDARELGPGRYGVVDVALERLLEWAREGRTIVLAVDPDDITPDDLGALERVADVYLDLRTELVGTHSVHIIRVRRFERPLVRVHDVVAFRVEPLVGIVLEIKEVYG